MAIEVGDAVFKFLGDTTHMDAGFDSVGPKAKAAFGPATEVVKEFTGEMAVGQQGAVELGEVVNLAGEKSRASMYQARGEAGLLGEAFGIHLPRHVRSFVTELPGVGTALSAAFSATAVLFLLEALVKGTEKLSEWVGATFIFTEAMKEQNKILLEENNTFIELGKQHDAAKARWEQLTGAVKDQDAAQIELTKSTLAGAEAQLTQLKASIANRGIWDKTKQGATDLANTLVQRLIPSYAFQTQAEKDLQAVHERSSVLESQRIVAAKVLADEKKNQVEATRERNIKEELAETENFKKIALASATSEEDKYQIVQYYEEKKLSLIKSLGVKEKDQVEALAAEIEAQQIQHALKMQDAFSRMMQIVAANQKGALDAVSQATITTTVEFNDLQKAMLKGMEAAHDMGVTLRTDLVDDLERAKKAKQDFLGAGIIDPVALKQFDNNIADMQKRLDNFGKRIQDLNSKNQTTWKGFAADLHTGATAMESLGKMGQQTFDQLSKSMESAIASAILASGSFGQAMEKATAQALASLAAQAIVKALFYTAEGFAALAGFAYGPASQYFEAAAVMGGVGVAAGVAGAALNGAAGGGSGQGGSQPHAGQNNGQSNTSGSGQRGTVAVRGFADGGLVTGPTLALIGEKPGTKGEAVMSLDNPDALAKIGAAIAAAGGGSGTTVHVHGHVIGANDVAHLVGQINKRVARGQATLLSSNSLRVTKRSA